MMKFISVIKKLRRKISRSCRKNGQNDHLWALAYLCQLAAIKIQLPPKRGIELFLKRRHGFQRGDLGLQNIAALCTAALLKAAKHRLTPALIDRGAGGKAGRDRGCLQEDPPFCGNRQGERDGSLPISHCAFICHGWGLSLPPELTPGVSVKRGWRGWGRCSSAGGHKRGGSNAAEKG